MRVNINIDSLVLSGFGRDDSIEFTEGLQHELSRLVKENGIEHISNMHLSNGGIVSLGRNTRPDLAGKQTAHSIYGSIWKK